MKKSAYFIAVVKVREVSGSFTGESMALG